MHPLFETISEIEKTIKESKEICKTFHSLQSIWMARTKTGLSKINSEVKMKKNYGIRDALLKTGNGQKLVIESTLISDRVRYLKQLVHDTFVVYVPDGFKRRFDFYQKSKPVVKKLAEIGGPAYEKAVDLVKFAYVDRRAYKDALNAILPPLEKMGEHNVRDYESSDIYMR